MVALASPLVLAPALVLTALFLAGWRYRFGSLPRAWVVAVFAASALWLAYSLASIPGLLADPADSAIVVAGALLLLSVAERMWRRIRA